MKYLLIVFITLAIGLTSQAQNTHGFQDTTKTETGYEIDFPHVHVIVDTITHISKVYNYYHGKSYFSVNGGKAVLLKKHKKNGKDIESSISVWGEHFTLVVIKKYYKGTYKI